MGWFERWLMAPKHRTLKAWVFALFYISAWYIGLALTPIMRRLGKWKRITL